MSTPLYERKFSPLQQACIVFAVALLLMGLGWLTRVSGLMDVEVLFPWAIATAFTLLFALLNSLMSLTADNSMQYYGSSVYSYVGLAFMNGVAARYISGVQLIDAESYRWIYIVITVGFLVFMSMVNLMKKIVQFAEREEWNEPKTRR
ncbi:MAG: hypothetical protein ACOYNO_06220 [Saprospiraceae bacterium]